MMGDFQATTPTRLGYAEFRCDYALFERPAVQQRASLVRPAAWRVGKQHHIRAPDWRSASVAHMNDHGAASFLQHDFSDIRTPPNPDHALGGCQWVSRRVYIHEERAAHANITQLEVAVCVRSVDAMEGRSPQRPVRFVPVSFWVSGSSKSSCAAPLLPGGKYRSSGGMATETRTRMPCCVWATRLECSSSSTRWVVALSLGPSSKTSMAPPRASPSRCAGFPKLGIPAEDAPHALPVHPALTAPPREPLHAGQKLNCRRNLKVRPSLSVFVI